MEFDSSVLNGEVVFTLGIALLLLGVNFINFLRAAFVHADPKSTKKTNNLTFFFALLWSAWVNAAHRMLMKWAIGLNKTGGIIYYPQYISGKEGRGGEVENFPKIVLVLQCLHIQSSTQLKKNSSLFF